MPPGPGQNAPLAQLTPQQLAALQDHIRQTRATTGQEVTPALIQAWMQSNGIPTGGPPQQQQQQQQQQQPQPPSLDAILNHLYPPQLAGNPPAALAHLQNVLFPANQGHKQSPLLQQVMLLAQNGRLSPEQMAMLKQAVALKNGAAQQNQQQQYQQGGTPQQQMNQQQQARAAAGAPSSSTNEQNATQAVQQLRNRVQHIETLLARPDINDEQRQKMQNELDNARANLARVIKMLIAAQAQQQAQAAQAQAQQQQQQQQVGAGATGQQQPQLNVANLQEAQRQAMERKAREIQAAQLQAAQAAAAQNGGTPQQYRTASPASYPGQLLPPPQPGPGAGPGGNGMRQSPSMGMAGGNLPALQASVAAATTKPLPAPQDPALAAIAAAAAAGKKLTKKQQADLEAYQAQAQAQAQAQVQALAQAQRVAQAQAVAAAQQQQQQQQQQQHQQQQQAGKVSSNFVAGLAASSSSSSAAAAGMSIPGTLSVQPPSAEPFPPPRPTLSGGLANNPSISTPAITRPPTTGTDGLFGAGGGGVGGGMMGGDAGPNGAGGGGGPGAAAGGVGAGTGGANSAAAAAAGTAGVVAGAMAAGGAAAAAAAAAANGGKADAIPGKELRPDDSKGRTVNKRKIRELVEAVDPQERLTDEVEDLLLEICDEFIDSVTRFGCQLAKHRKSDRLEVKDLALHLERSYNIRVPGFSGDEAKVSGTRRVNIPPGHAARLAAIREGGRRR